MLDVPSLGLRNKCGSGVLLFWGSSALGVIGIKSSIGSCNSEIFMVFPPLAFNLKSRTDDFTVSALLSQVNGFLLNDSI